MGEVCPRLILCFLLVTTGWMFKHGYEIKVTINFNCLCDGEMWFWN